VSADDRASGEGASSDRTPGEWLGFPAARVAVGSQWRRQSLESEVDGIQAAGRIAGNTIPPTPLDEEREVGSAFVELVVPIAERVETQLAARYDHYEDFGSTVNPKVALGWRPVDELLVRATWGTSFRAPAFRELRDP
jgi:outer membrane cobalamin receptor